uniref:Uncharacterized protein n=1 Tax=Myoviridae sp. ct8ME27 TaxID=2826622 RepID=A0A8S5N889_9CAUD|nr:MAG TPA: hypothetical protein [Myoviridae sp. ct8ME27]
MIICTHEIYVFTRSSMRVKFMNLHLRFVEKREMSFSIE